MQMDPAEFIKQHCYGVLATQSVSHLGYPFGSIVPYVISADGFICIYISELAEHTKNISENSKVSLTIADVQTAQTASSAPRICCLAEARKSDDQQRLSLLYQQQFPDAEIILQLPGFMFYQLELAAVRLIGGFGDIKWLSPKQLSLT
jgi:hypothetical protein